MMSKASLTPVFLYDLASGVILLLLSFSVLFVRSTPPSKDAASDEVTPIVVSLITPRRSLIRTILSLAALTYAADASVAIVRVILSGTWGTPGPIAVAPFLVGLVAFGLLAIFLSWKDLRGVDVWQRRRVRLFAVLAVLFEFAHLIVVATAGNLRDGRPPISSPEKPTLPAVLFSPYAHFSLSVLRLLVILPLYPALAYPYRTYVPSSSPAGQRATEEPLVTATSSLLIPSDVPFQSSSGLLAPKPQYGTFNSAQPSTVNSRAHTPTASESAIPHKPDPRADINLDPTWREMGQRIRRLIPYLWPAGVRKLEFLALFCFVLLIAGRFVAYYVPTTLRQLVATFEQQDKLPRPSPWPLVFLYAGLRFLQGSGGLGALRDIAWAPVMQYSDRRMSQMSFDHLLNLSLAFHTRRKTGEVLRILDRGAAINHIFELLLFNIFPTLVDIVVALTVFVVYFNWTLSAVIFLVMFTYTVSSIALTTWRTKIRRQMNDRDVITRGIHTDCLLNYETVKYFGGEAHEAERYREAIQKYQALEFKVMASLNLLNLVQNFIISFGLLVGSLLVAVDVVNGVKNTSDFIFFITYLAQVYGPLNNLGYIYRSINQSLVDTERLLKLLDESTDVNDKPGAPDLVVTDGEIEFRNVSFTYDERTTALQNISFKVPKGSSVALVGESGSGKSTILRLLYRFYDLKEGHGQILIDGQDIRDVSQASLRRAIGYGKFGATQEEIEYAAQAAQMHERILSFPDGYGTKVGERGVRLSGGEKQRVSIARTFLKNAPILLLDEATSALDTTTEKDIQKALQNLLTGRSSLSIAHRLSTIANSDIILVLKDGEVVESGAHRDLVAANGLFAAMWAEQVTADSQSQIVDFNQSTKEAASGYTVLELPASVPLDFTEQPVGHEAIFPSSEPQQQSILAPGPVYPPASFQDLEVDNVEESQEKVTEVNDAAPVSDRDAEDVTTPVGPSESGPSHAPVVTSSLPEETGAPPAPVAFPSSDPPIVFPSSDAPIAFPSDDVSTREVVDAPSPEFEAPGDSEDAGAPTSPVTPALPTGVTFSQTESPRSGTPEPGDSTKRKRISSQNFQRLARRISIGGRKATQQAADAVRAVTMSKDKEPARGGSPAPKESLVSKMGFGRASSSRDDASSRGEGGSGSARIVVVSLAWTSRGMLAQVMIRRS
ncbi:hypothetical protein BS47DRAFT_1483796 [Hydnum rufescens UP504]|uniref:Mitochondrial half-size ABC transporter n=1 Tax=Hydnum rufescens UP504 TaxID=1448309 RepID=A0A9P6B2U7_9AGAM|nr:hypothetical protein BS47DRAFT_1483796 [Hydnum rufescens UP504]